MSDSSHVDSGTMIAAILLCIMFLWTLFLIFDINCRPNPPSPFACLGLLLHNVPALCLLTTTQVARKAEDRAMVWFIFLLAFRYWRTIVNIFFWFCYKPVLATGLETITAADCTVIVPTVGPVGNSVFGEMVSSILINQPARLVFSTNTNGATKQLEDFLPGVVEQLKLGVTTYQQQYGIGHFGCTTEIHITNAEVSNKRHQVVNAFSQVKTDILVMADDSAIWNPKFLQATLPAFSNTKVGLVGTRKWVKHLPRHKDPSANFIRNMWLYYWSGMWNALGGLYLIRHNFEIRSTNAADGGVFCVSGRTSLIRTSIVNNESFKHAFLNEYILRIGNSFAGWGPVKADDDNFITRHVVNAGYDIKIQYSEYSTITTVLGGLPLKFPHQCHRWSRTTFRQNPITLFADRTIWWKWPLTLWTTYFPWLYNAALIWDGFLIRSMTKTKFYAESQHRLAILIALIIFIWATKLVKTIPWFWQHPMDFFLYFLIPAYPIFCYYHSLLKIWTAFTFWDLAWSGRRLPRAK